MPQINNNIVEIENLYVRLPGRRDPILQGISLQIARGEIYGIFGETGCGKSTLAQCLVGFVPAACIEGHIQFYFQNQNGIDVAHADRQTWQRLRGNKIVYVPQDPYKALNPFERIGCQLKRLCPDSNGTLTRIMESVQLPVRLLESFSQTLSAGQRQKVMMAMAMAVKPELLILDEPAASVDAAGRQILRRCFGELTAAGHTLVIVSHETQDYRDLIPAGQRFTFSSPAQSLTVETGPPYSSQPATPLLELCDVRKNFGKLPVLTGVDLTVASNEWVYLEGDNGCGKSTLLHILLGLLAPDHGGLHWRGQCVPWNNLRYSRYIHPVFQDVFHSLNPKLAIEKSIAEVAYRLSAGHRQELEVVSERLQQELRLFPALLKMLPQQLSYGQQKRVALLRALLKFRAEMLSAPNDSHLLIFDEIFSGIHWQLRHSILHLLQDLRRDYPFSAIWVAHQQPELQQFCDSTYCLSSGRLQSMILGVAKDEAENLSPKKIGC